MKRWQQGALIVAGSVAVTAGLLAMAVAWTDRGRECAAQFPKVVGCALGTFENLSGGLIAAAGALFAGWLAWSSSRDQIAFEQMKAIEEARRVKQFERDRHRAGLIQLQTAGLHAAKLLDQMRDSVKGGAPYATRLYEMWENQLFPSTSTDLTAPDLGMGLWEAVNRVRMVAQQIHAGVQLGAGELRGPYMSRNESRAKAAVENFAVIAQNIPTLIETQRRRIEELSGQDDE